MQNESDFKLKFLLALWFHDVIYDGRSALNEDESAVVFKKFAAETDLSEEITNIVVQIIIDTKTHTPAVGLGDEYTELS